jgi:hypothetical protein
MNRAQADRLYEQLEAICDDVISEVKEARDELTQAQAIGMSALRDHLLRQLDFREFAKAAEPTPASRAAALVQRYCRNQCGASRTQPPGAAEQCGGCDLRPVAIGVWEEQAEQVIDE